MEELELWVTHAGLTAILKDRVRLQRDSLTGEMVPTQQDYITNKKQNCTLRKVKNSTRIAA